MILRLREEHENRAIHVLLYIFHLPENIRLIFQPASSPEVNPVAHVWEELREK